MLRIEDLQLAAALAQAPSLSAAARALNVTPPALSMRLRKLEAALGLSLAVRTARRLGLTAEGERFAREAAELLGRLEALPQSFQRDDRQLTGTLRIAAPFGYGRQRIAPMLARFSRLHPGLRLLPGRFMVIEQAMGMPRGRSEQAAAFLRHFVEDMKRTGFVAEAMRRHGIQGAMVAPPASV